MRAAFRTLGACLSGLIAVLGALAWAMNALSSIAGDPPAGMDLGRAGELPEYKLESAPGPSVEGPARSRRLRVPGWAALVAWARRRRRFAIVFAVLAVFGLGVGLYAYFTAGATAGSAGQARAGTVGAPTGVTGPTYSATHTVPVSWTGSTLSNGGAIDGYYVTRYLGSTPSAACGTSFGSLTTLLSCSDTSVPDGTYTYTVTAVFHNWLKESAPSAAVIVDTTKPQTTLTTSPVSPDGTNNWFKQASVTFTLNATDGGSGVASSHYTVDGGAPQTYSGTVTINTQGDHTVTFWSVDNAGNIEDTNTTHIKLDNVVPTGSVTAPLASANVRGSTVAVSSNSADGTSGVASATFQRSPSGAGTWTDIATDTTNPYSVNWNTTGLTDGLYDLRVVTTDNAGNTFNSTLVTVRVDNTAPTGSVTTPADGANLSANALGNTISVGSNSADTGSGVASAMFERSVHLANSWTQINGLDSTVPYSVSMNINSLADGQYDLRVTTTDNAGNTFTSALITVRVDNTPPATTDNTASLTNAWKTTDQTVTLSPTDAGSGVDKTYSTKGSPTAVAPTTASTQGTSVALTGDGLWQVKYFSTDIAGNAETVKTAGTVIRIDKTNPTPGSFSLPAFITNGQALTNTATDSTVNGASSGVASVQYFYCSGVSCTPSTSIGTGSTGPSYSVSWSSQPADGTYRVMATVTDIAGNSASSAIVSTTIDNTNPTGSITAPSGGTSVHGSTVTVSSDSADGGSGVVSARFQRSVSGANTWTDIATDTTNPYSVTWNTTTLTDGLYDLRAITTDGVGHTFTSTLVTVRVDNTAPTAAITFPVSGTTYRATTYNAGCSPTGICGTAADATGVQTVNVSIKRNSDNTYWNGSIFTGTTETFNLATGTTSWNYPFALPADGSYTVHVQTADTVGNAQTGTTYAATSTFTIDATAPSLTTLQMFDTNANGKVDQVKATFNESLAACTAPCTTGWTLSGTPSGGSLSSVTIAGAVATLNLTEGGGAADTAVGSFTIALSAASGIADAAGNHSSFAATAPADKAAPVLVTASSSGGTANLMQTGDTMDLTFSEPIAAGSIPGSATVKELRTGGSTVLTIPGVIQSASIANGYVSGNGSGGSATGTITLTNSNKTIHIVLGTVTAISGGVAGGSGGATLSPDGAITDVASNGAVTTSSALCSPLF